MFNTILCAADFTPVSERAIAYAVDLASSVGAELHLVHSVEPAASAVTAPGPGAHLGTPTVGFGAPWPRDAVPAEALPDKGDLEMLVKRFSTEHVQPKPHLVKGAPAGAICELADEIDADLLVVGSEGRKGFSRLVFGSTAESISRRSERPILVVPSPPGPRDETEEEDAASTE